MTKNAFARLQKARVQRRNNAFARQPIARGRVIGAIAGGAFDERCTVATRINNAAERCFTGHRISATQSRNTVTMVCDCGTRVPYECNALFGVLDALVAFHDYHREHVDSCGIHHAEVLPEEERAE